MDQTLEEVEEQISEIGSKMYHDMIMKERSVDISSLMKGVFGLSNTPTRRYLLNLDVYMILKMVYLTLLSICGVNSS